MCVDFSENNSLILFDCAIWCRSKWGNVVSVGDCRPSWNLYSFLWQTFTKILSRNPKCFLQLSVITLRAVSLHFYWRLTEITTGQTFMTAELIQAVNTSPSCHWGGRSCRDYKWHLAHFGVLEETSAVTVINQTRFTARRWLSDDTLGAGCSICTERNRKESERERHTLYIQKYMK